MPGVESRPILGETSKDIGCDERDKPCHVSEEWVPPSLKRVRAFSLATFCVVFTAALQGLDSAVRLKHGLPASQPSIVNAVTYLPTVGTILLGFSWYGVVSDIKRVTPWSNMSSRWAYSAESVSLDYVTSLEILSMFTALRRRHWPMSLALLGGFLCGATVALANSLVRIDLFSPSSRAATFTRSSHFNFENALVEQVSDTYKYAFPTDYRGSRPYAAVQTMRDSTSNAVPWTSGGYAFESFSDESATVFNSTISAAVQSFSPSMNCTSWSVTKSTDGYLEADFPGDICENTFREGDFAPETLTDGATGWLNITMCNTTLGTTKSWITARLSYDADSSLFDLQIQNQWLICDPQFTMQDAVVNVNKTTGQTISFSPSLLTAQTIEMNIPTAFILMFLRNPLEPSNQWFTPLNSAITEEELIWAIWKNRGPDPDTFFVSLADSETLYSAAPKYMNDSQLFKEDVEALGNSVFAQLINFFARESISEQLAGSVGTTEPRLYLRQPFLRTLQVVLVLIGVIAGLMATVLRPKTLLKEDPGSMAAAAAIMANSNSLVQKTFANLSTCSETEMISSLRPIQWNVSRTPEGSAGLDSSATSAAVDFEKKNDSSGPSTYHNTGFKPMSLSWWARLSVGALLVAMIIALALLLKRSLTQDGIHDNTSTASMLFSLLPTVALLLLTYACSGTDSAVRTLTAFRGLGINGSNVDQLRVNVRDSPFFWVHRHGLKAKHSWALIASSLCFFMIPGIKLVAAGLYDVELFQTRRNVTDVLQVDTSIAAHLNDNSSIPEYSSGAFSERVSSLAEWAMIEEWRLSERVGALGNLVFSDLTDIRIDTRGGALQGAEVVTQVPAVEVEVNCSQITVDLVGTYQNEGWTYRFQCSTTDCEQAGVAVIYNQTINLGNPGGSDRAGFNETGYWYDGFHKFYGVFGTPFKRLNNEGSVSFQPELWQIHFIDFSNTLWPLVNKTPVELNSDNQIRVTPEAFGSHLPIITSAKCPLNLNTLDVLATFTSSLSPTDTVQWAPTSFDGATITNRAPADPFGLAVMSSWLQPQVASGMETQILSSDTYFPTEIRATNFFELLAVYANNTLHNMSAYDSNPASFLAACETVSTAYTVQALLELRPWARAAAAPRRDRYPSDKSYELALAAEPNDSMRNVSGMLTYSRERIVQNATSTYVLVGLLALMLVCLGVVFLLTPVDAVLPKSPGSIAARMSLIAGSQLVKDLRKGQVPESSSVTVDARVPKATRMGWWPEEDGRRCRWGIDVGEGCLDGSWNDDPKRERRSIEQLLQEQPLIGSESSTGESNEAEEHSGSS